MAISLLGNNPNALTANNGGPLAQLQKPVNPNLAGLGSKISLTSGGTVAPPMTPLQTASYNAAQSMGLTPKSPSDNLTQQNKKLATSQVAKTQPSITTPPPPTPAPTGNAQNIQTKDANGNTIYTSGTPEALPGALASAGGTKSSPQNNPVPETKTDTSASGILGSLVDTAKGNQAIGQSAADIAARYGKQYADTGLLGAAAQGGYRTTGTTPVAEGNAAVIGQTTAAQQAAIAAGEQAALQGTAQQLTSQSQTQSGLSSALTGSLNTTSTPYGTPVVRTATGEVLNPGAGGTGSGGIQLTGAPAQDIQNLATSLVNNPSGMGYTAAYNQISSAYGSAVANQLLPALQKLNPSFSVTTSDAQAAANAANVQTGGTAAVNAGASTYAQANPAYLNLKNNIIPNIDNFGTLLQQGAGGINPFDAQYGNSTLQQFQSQLSSPQQAAFQATFQQLQNSIAQLAGAGGAQTPTANSAQSDATLSPTSKMSTIKSTLERIAQEGNIYLTNQGNLSNAALSQAQGGSGATGGTGAITWQQVLGGQ